MAANDTIVKDLGAARPNLMELVPAGAALSFLSIRRFPEGATMKLSIAGGTPFTVSGLEDFVLDACSPDAQRGVTFMHDNAYPGTELEVLAVYGGAFTSLRG